MLKKIGKSILFILLAIPSLAFAATTLTGISIHAISIEIPTAYESGSEQYCFFQDQNSLGCSDTTDFSGSNPQTQNLVTDWSATDDESLAVDMVLANAGSSCGSGTLTDCEADPDWISSTHFTALTGVTRVVSTANTTFSNALGFNVESVGVWMVAKMLLIVGSILGILGLLLPYIMALTIIGGIVWFIYRGFKFFRH